MSLTLDEIWSVTLAAAEGEFRRGIDRDETQYPAYGEDDEWVVLPVDRRSSWSSEGSYDHGNWMSGFWFGVMWLLSYATGNEAVADLARKRLGRLRPRTRDHTTHDLGFIAYPAWVLPARLGLLGDPETGPAREAAEMLLRRFNPRGSYLQAFGAVGHPQGAGTSTIDTLMNLPLLWWAGSQYEMHTAHETARVHARTSARTIVRSDGSTYHLNTFDPTTGTLLHSGTFQGADTGSCWSRGQAWGVAGFAWAYAATRDREFLRAAEATADYFLGRLPEDGVPPWDFSDEGKDALGDASAAAIAAVGTSILARLHPDARQAASYAQATEWTLLRLGVHALNRREDVEGILLRSCYSKPHGLGLQGPTPWGDFYFFFAQILHRCDTREQLLSLLGLRVAQSDSTINSTEGEQA